VILYAKQRQKDEGGGGRRQKKCFLLGGLEGIAQSLGRRDNAKSQSKSAANRSV